VPLRVHWHCCKYLNRSTPAKKSSVIFLHSLQVLHSKAERTTVEGWIPFDSFSHRSNAIKVSAVPYTKTNTCAFANKNENREMSLAICHATCSIRRWLPAFLAVDILVPISFSPPTPLSLSNQVSKTTLKKPQ
jgi:hypothetical protein